ncbi:Hypothetical predicted protein, partial [Marmota monax]
GGANSSRRWAPDRAVTATQEAERTRLRPALSYINLVLEDNKFKTTSLANYIFFSGAEN